MIPAISRLLGCLVLAFTLFGCSYSNRLMPLRGEDPASVALSEERAGWLEESGATRALARLRKALRADEAGRVLDLLGPSTRAIVRARAADAGKSPADLIRTGEVPGMGLPDAAHPLRALAADGAFTVHETGAFDPARREVRLVVRVGDGPEFHVPAVFADDAWRIELVGRVAVGDAVPAIGGE